MVDSVTALAWARSAWPERSWAGAQVLRGAFHEVVLTRECAARTASGRNQRARVGREAQLLQAASQLGLTSDAACGLIDFDHFGWGDSAIDVAPLVGKFSLAQVSSDFEPGLLRRPMFHRAALSLQVASAAELAGDLALRDHALANFVHRARAGTLYDPAGASPAAPGRAARH